MLTQYFPEDDEPGITSEDEAWNLAREFADKIVCWNVYVVDAHTKIPVREDHFIYRPWKGGS